MPIGQGDQAVVYVPNAVPEGTGMLGLQPLGVAAQAAHFTMMAVRRGGAVDPKAPSNVTLFDQGLVQVLEAAVTGLEPKQTYVLALSSQADGGGKLEPLASFMTNPTGAQIVNAVGPIRQIVMGEGNTPRRYLVIAPGTPSDPGEAVQIQAP